METPQKRNKERISICVKGTDSLILIPKPITFQSLTESAISILELPGGNNFRFCLSQSGQIFDWNYELVRDNDIIEVEILSKSINGPPRMTPKIENTSPYRKPLTPDYTNGRSIMPVMGEIMNSPTTPNGTELKEPIEKRNNETFSVIVNGREIGSNNLNFEITEKISIAKICEAYQTHTNNTDPISLYLNDTHLDPQKTAGHYNLSHECHLIARHQI